MEWSDSLPFYASLGTDWNVNIKTIWLVKMSHVSRVVAYDDALFSLEKEASYDKRSRANQLRLFTVKPSFILQGKNTTSRTTSRNWSTALEICFSNQMERPRPWLSINLVLFFHSYDIFLMVPEDFRLVSFFEK